MKSVAFDLSGWHDGVDCARMFVPGFGGIGVKVCCVRCGVLCDVEAIGTRIPVEASYLTADQLPEYWRTARARNVETAVLENPSGEITVVTGD